MPSRELIPPDRTPAGGLGEAGLRQVVGYQLAQATLVTDAVFEEQVAQPSGLRQVEYTLLTLVADNPGVSPARLARALAVTPPHVTALLTRLEERALVRRDVSAQDRRSQSLVATRKGVELARQATARILETERAVLGLTPGEQAILAELLHKVACARGRKPAAEAAQGG